MTRGKSRIAEIEINKVGGASSLSGKTGEQDSSFPKQQKNLKEKVKEGTGRLREREN